MYCDWEWKRSTKKTDHLLLRRNKNSNEFLPVLKEIFKFVFTDKHLSLFSLQKTRTKEQKKRVFEKVNYSSSDLWKNKVVIFAWHWGISSNSISFYEVYQNVMLHSDTITLLSCTKSKCNESWYQWQHCSLWKEIQASAHRWKNQPPSSWLLEKWVNVKSWNKYIQDIHYYWIWIKIKLHASTYSRLLSRIEFFAVLKDFETIFRKWL